MRIFFVSYLADKEPKNNFITLYDEKSETAKGGALAFNIMKEVESREKYISSRKKNIVLINFWEIYDET